MTTLTRSTNKFVQDIEATVQAFASAEANLEKNWPVQSNRESREPEDDQHDDTVVNPVTLIRRIQALEQGLATEQSRWNAIAERKRTVVPQLHGLLAQNQRFLDEIQAHAESTQDPQQQELRHYHQHNTHQKTPSPLRLHPSQVSERAQMLSIVQQNADLYRPPAEVAAE